MKPGQKRSRVTRAVGQGPDHYARGPTQGEFSFALNGRQPVVVVGSGVVVGLVGVVSRSPGKSDAGSQRIA